MPGAIEALKNFKPRVVKHTITVEGRTVEVTLDKKLETIRNGIENYYLKEDGTPVLREKKNTRHIHPEIETFVGDPYWPEETFVWKK